ncbi:MAG: phospho-sugar mutase [Peptostreptococcaceae bacterium]|nr:phospho-sugar mutase [Peptostreptococcaceae bacterium]
MIKYKYENSKEGSIMIKYMQNFERWLKEPKLGEKLKLELLELKSQGETAFPEIEDRFYRDLEFGTGGLRGILGAGTNRMNIHTVAKTVQGLANYVTDNYEERLKKGNNKKPSIAISYDSRINSELFAKTAAKVLMVNSIDVYLYKELMPTPALSFATRYYHCDGGIMITASHNPSKYNGVKVYNKDGCQETLEAAKIIMEKIESLDPFNDIKIDSSTVLNHGKLTYIPEEAISAYIDAVHKELIPVDCELDKLNVVYTPLNGTGNKPVRRILKKIGIKSINVVKEQENPDGYFTTCPYPNPEKEEALTLAKALFRELYDHAESDSERPDVLLATDPDSDRIGVACLYNDEIKTLTGNEVGILLFDFICNHRKLPEHPVAVRTIVSTKMIDSIAKNYGVEIITTLTGFKFIGEQIGYLEEKGESERYIFGFEESVGYLTGAYVRDKDAVNAAMLICQMVGFYKKQGITMFEKLEDLYKQYGYWKNDLIEFAFEGAKGMQIMSGIMNHFRTKYYQDFAGKKITEIVDYKKKTRRIIKGNSCNCSMVSGTRPTNLPSSDVLEFILEGGSCFALRPSGTEPKFKIYIGSKANNRKESAEILEQLSEELAIIIKDITK